MTSMRDADTEPTYYYNGIADVVGEEGLWDFADRYDDFARYVTFEPTDRVLDVGCAEGLISMEIARQVKYVDSIELRMERVEAARKLAENRGIDNIRFGQGSAADLQLQAESYDSVLFLGVFHHLSKEDKLPSLMKLMMATRRQLVMRTPLIHPKSPNRTSNIYRAIEKMNFIVTIYPNRDQFGGNLMIMTRAGR
jgi:2-polyprenyl-3-methyl-5-hydroxy-6-metoxy-1,4-benzoquinol methylase